MTRLLGVGSVTLRIKVLFGRGPIVVRPPNIGVLDRRYGYLDRDIRLLVDVVFEQGFDALVVDCVNGECFAAGGFCALVAVTIAKADEAQTGAEALLGMGAAGKDALPDLA